jgi:penicillin-binding protein 1A
MSKMTRRRTETSTKSRETAPKKKKTAQTVRGSSSGATKSRGTSAKPQNAAKKRANTPKKQSKKTPKKGTVAQSDSPKVAPLKPGRRRWRGRLARFFLILFIWGVLAVGCGIAYFAYTLPDLDKVANITRAPSMTVRDASGQHIASYGQLHGQGVQVQDLPAYLPQAVLATEDRSFYDHFGVDPVGILRAVYRNVSSGRYVQGGSTITQQVAKNLFLSREKTITRKIRELLLAFWLEHTFTKDQILTLYLNRVYLGAGTYGMDAAAQKYFHKPVQGVNLYEAAILAGLLKAPSRYNPLRSENAAHQRATVVLQNMVHAGYITQAQADAAKAGGTQYLRAALAPSQDKPGLYFTDWVSSRVPSFVGQPDADLVVYTTLDYALQKTAEQIVRRTLAQHGRQRNISQAAVVVMDKYGAIKAMVGGRSYRNSQFNRVTQALRQPGSAFKPFVYMAAVLRGYRADTMVDDRPLDLKGWSPQNFDGLYRGTMPMAEALAKSINTVAVRLALDVGVDAVIRTAKKMGFGGDLRADPAIALGASEATLLDLTSAYAPLANGGATIFPHGIQKITTRGGDVLYQRDANGAVQTLPVAAVHELNIMLQRAILAGTAHRAGIAGIPMAGKTGTSQDYRDALFVGYTSEFVAGVWVGNDNRAPMNKVTGGTIPAEIWQAVMAKAHQYVAAQPLP